MTKYKVVIEFDMEGNVLKGHKLKRAKGSPEPPVEAYLAVLKRLLLQVAAAAASAGVDAGVINSPSKN